MLSLVACAVISCLVIAVHFSARERATPILMEPELTPGTFAIRLAIKRCEACFARFHVFGCVLLTGDVFVKALHKNEYACFVFSDQNSDFLDIITRAKAMVTP